jgi:hypothetical protein
MKIGDLVCIDEHGDFRSDVQLSDYDNPKLNQELLRNYIFTVSAPATSGAGRDLSAKEVLDKLKEAFISDIIENRMALTANYGHGKSHLALTLANFFARPAHSTEVEIIFNRLGQALNNQAALSGYREFKESRGEFLVVRLQGDSFDDLQEGFLRALEKALSEHDCTRNTELTFWYKKAEDWLDGLNEENRQRIDSFLDTSYNIDLASLRQDLRKAGSYELIREAFKYLTGAYPDFGREVSLKDLVLWAVDKICVPKKMGGLLILFDEFSLFLQKYAASRAAGKLQELLNGISDRKGKSAFLAFAQQDIDSVLDTYAHGTHLENIRRELDRLPKDKRARLFSVMESVLDAYLKQDQIAWEGWIQKQPIRAAMVRSREMLYDYFDQRYNRTLRWDLDKCNQIVVKGCYPLHPLTTAILSTHTFEAGTGENVRTALHFIRDRWEKGLREQTAEREDGEPNFVFATALVDFFGEQISKKWYEAYQAALQTARIPLDEDHRTALKALLLQQAVKDLDRKKTRGGDQLTLLSALCGLSPSKLKDILRELSEKRIVDHDPDQKVYKLLSTEMRSPETEMIIEEAIQKTSVDLALLKEVAAKIPQLEINLSFGAADDWAPHQVILTEEFFTPETLKTMLLPYRAGPEGIEEGVRGLVVWLVAQTEEEKVRLRQNAQKVLDEAIGMNAHPLPVVILLPKYSTSGLLKYARRKKALETLSQSERERIGTIGYQNEITRARSDFESEFKNFIDPEHYADLSRQIHEYALPGVYRASVDILGDKSLRSILTTLYRQAYAHRIDFYNQYKEKSNNLSKAVRKVALFLFSDQIAGSIAGLGNQDIQAQITKSYLPGKWGLLSEDYTIQPPASRALREAWNCLENAFPPGCKETRAGDVLLDLLNPPYGHDYNTLTLLLAAWIGYHRHEIRISLGGHLNSLDQFKNHFDQTRSPKDFLDGLVITSPLAISRINMDEMFAEVHSILEQIQQKQPFILFQAEQALAKLQQALENPRLSPDRREAIETYGPRLQEALSKAQEYDRKVGEWVKEFQTADFEKLLTLRNSLDPLHPPLLVSPSQPAPAQLQEDWEKRLKSELETFCHRYAQLSDLGDYKAHETQLSKALRALREYPQFKEPIQKALEDLKQRREQLEQAQNEKPIIAEINSMAASAGLADLYQYQEKLDNYKNLSPTTESLRQHKAAEIQTRIQQFEKLADELPQVVDRANSLSTIREQKDLLLRNLEQTRETRLYQKLLTIQQRAEQLEKFFEQLQAVEAMPKNSPEALSDIEAKISAIEEQCSSWLSPMQRHLLEQHRQQIKDLSHRETQKANEWLRNLELRYRERGNFSDLLETANHPPAFLSAEDRDRLEKVKQELKQAIDNDYLLKIENLFKQLPPETRNACLQRLQKLVNEL